MLHILLVSARQETLRPLAEGLAADPEVRLEEISSGAEALRVIRTNSPQLAIIDFELPDREPLPLVQELLTVNAMVNTAVVSSLTEEEFHEASEGLGILAHLPLRPGKSDAVELLRKFRQILGLSSISDRPA
jgi:DNA-binding response OmpR family regulator